MQKNNSNTEFSFSGLEKIELPRLISILRQHKYLFIAVFFFSFLLAFLYLRYTPPIYEASTILQIRSKNTANQVLQVDNIYESNDISAEIELMR